MNLAISSIAPRLLRGIGEITGVINNFNIESTISLVNSIYRISKAINSDAIPDGLKETKEFGRQHGQKVYKIGDKYYSENVDGHNGGSWKVFVKQGNKLKRIGTADENLQIFKK